MRSTAISPESKLLLPALNVSDQEKLPVSALLDSGAEQNLISRDLVDRLSILTRTLQLSLTVVGITGQSLARILLQTLKTRLSSPTIITK